MKRRAFQLVVLLILGAIVNVAVAWSIAIAPRPSFVGFERQLVESRPQTFVWTSEYEVLITQSSGINSNWWIGQPPTRVNEDSYRRLVPSGSAFSGHDPVFDFHTDNIMVDVSERMFGWPALSIACKTTIRYKSPNEIDVEATALRLPEHWSVGTRKNKTRVDLPLIPIWPGFAINTILYAAILWGVFFVPGQLKRTLRRRRGLCPACAYPVGTSPICTECGKPLKTPKAESQIAESPE